MTDRTDTMTDGSIKLVVLDMAGTTVADGGLVEQAFSRAAERLGVEPGSDDHAKKLDYVRATMGESKITVFRALFGDEDIAQRGNAAFESAYAELVDGGRCAPLPGAAETIGKLRDEGRTVVLTTGFSRVTQDAILDALGWQDIADLTLCPADAGRGRPFPDLVLAALLRTGAADDVREIAVAGDTSYDMLCGRRSGASVVAGVLTGAHDEAALRGAGATHVLASVAELPRTITGFTGFAAADGFGAAAGAGQQR
ncbi:MULTISPECIES: phosphonatase-like hydrolase [unclassified Streptomyces]|uniref:phosphonatase-like hydrolase n=1 Tax=unclassified Streptomyces TaxID=2593676 RepID=UPI001FD1A524|nr:MULTISPECIES: phosphonatase-like hydrolase [unclassified Streptomyces]MCZ4098655.1 phosphonatase-like hydrolase [Streptomyces sp. H39-C1]